MRGINLMSKRLILLVRHAEPVLPNDERRYLGHSNPVLSPKGISQAGCLAEGLKNIPLEGIYSSDLIRAVQTSEIIAKKFKLEVQLNQGLREINMGEWDNLSFEEVRSRFPAEYEKRGLDIVNYHPPDGESFADLSGRVIPIFHEIIASSKGNIVIVSHAGAIRVILTQLMALPLDRIFSFKQQYACLNTILSGEKGYCVKEVNMVIP